MSEQLIDDEQTFLLICLAADFTVEEFMGMI